jgi:hypothetical protein
VAELEVVEAFAVDGRRKLAELNKAIKNTPTAHARGDSVSAAITPSHLGAQAPAPGAALFSIFTPRYSRLLCRQQMVFPHKLLILLSSTCDLRGLGSVGEAASDIGPAWSRRFFFALILDRYRLGVDRPLFDPLLTSSLVQFEERAILFLALDPRNESMATAGSWRVI